jgi:hypothetical protein
MFILHSSLCSLPHRLKPFTCPIQVLGVDEFAQTIYPALERHFFSSTAAVWSQPGACHYSAANAHMDAMAQLCRCGGLSWTAHMS